jgi:hypothetical protein
MQLAIGAAALLAWSASAWAVNPHGDAQFWLSLYDTASQGPTVPSIRGHQNETTALYIWGRPGTVNGGAFNASTNPFMQLTNLSLNLVPNPSNPVSIDFLDSGITVYNPLLTATAHRFEYVFDSSTGLLSDGALPDSVHGIQGYTIASSKGLGIGGGACNPNDSYCTMTPSGPAWLIASVKFQTLQNSGAIGYSLQIGDNGMNYLNESTSLATAVFGVDTVVPTPAAYHADTNRSTTLPNDDPDITITASIALPGDYNHNGFVDAADYVIWRDSRGRTGSALLADGTSSNLNGIPNNVVDTFDYNFWVSKFGTFAPGAGSGSLASGTVPEPASAVLLGIGLALAVVCRARRFI